MPRGVKKVTKETKEVNVNATEEVMNEPIEKEATEAPKKKSEPKKVTRHYEDSDLIPCRSIMSGYLNMYMPKTKLVMEWTGNGDICNIEYQDLRAAMISRAPHIMKPYIIIEDEELLELPEWSAVKKLYESMYTTDDISEVLDLPIDQMKQVIKQLPAGAKSALVSIARERIDNQTFDSMNKIKAIDEEFGTDLMLFMMEE